MALSVMLLALSATAGGDGRPTFVRFGSDLARGVLVNHSAGANPGDPPAPGRPTVVFIHGFNPVPRIVHFDMAERLAEALGRRAGPSLNVLGWNWNGATFVSLDPRANGESAVAQGRSLAAALRGAGVRPWQLHLIGHSSGSIVAASAAREFLAESGRPILQMTLLDPAALYHSLLFERLGAGASAHRVENYWSPDPGAYGRAVAHPNVWNHRINAPRPYLGVVRPRRSSHLYIVSWYIATVGDPTPPHGFNRSLLLAGGN